jgi:hypothetical protein
MLATMAVTSDALPVLPEKRRPGRPRVAEPRTVSVTTCVTAREYDRLYHVATACGLPISQVVRRAVVVMTRPRPDQEGR